MPTVAVLLALTCGGVVCGALGAALLLVPRRSRHLASAAREFCLHRCRPDEAGCPLDTQAVPCPLWRFVDADVPLHPVESVVTADHRRPAAALDRPTASPA